jgi:hypothetical protein
MSDIFCDCMVCDGYAEYGGKPCAFCDGNGGLQLASGSYREMEELAKEYMEFIDKGGNPEDWDD